MECHVSYAAIITHLGQLLVLFQIRLPEPLVIIVILMREVIPFVLPFAHLHTIPQGSISDSALHEHNLGCSHNNKSHGHSFSPFSLLVTTAIPIIIEGHETAFNGF
jgi:hypothetical protein